MVDAKKVKAWLDEKVGTVRCTLCRSTDINISRDLLTLPLDDPNPQKGKTTPVVVVRLRCGHCAHIMLLHARSIGVF